MTSCFSAFSAAPRAALIVLLALAANWPSLSSAQSGSTPPRIISATELSANVFQSINYQIILANFATGTFAADGLPKGLTLDASSGVISGTVGAVGTYAIALSATNSDGTGRATLTLTVSSPGAPVINGDTRATGTQGIFFRLPISATNFPTRYTADNLPPGLALDPSAGLIQGTPLVVGVYDVALTAANEVGTAAGAVTITILTQGTPTLASVQDATINQGAAYSLQIEAAGSPTGYAASGLPPGLTVDAASGLISGAPTVSGDYTVTLSATNLAGTSQEDFRLTVLPVAPPEITSATTVSGQPGVGFNFQIGATNSTTSFAVDPLPDGLGLDPATGLITGVPVTLGEVDAKVSATNIIGTTEATLHFIIASGLPLVTVEAVTPVAMPQRGQVAAIKIRRDGGDLTQPLIVTLSIKGNAKNGVDFRKLPTQFRIKPGKASRRIVVGGALETDPALAQRTVKFKIMPGDSYQVGAQPAAKVKILYTP